MERRYARPRIVVSRCIEFDPCRYDGSRISSPLVAHLRSHADCIPVCPEVEIGLGIPRATVRLVRQDGEDRLVQPATGRDVTPEMTAFAARFLDALPPVDGFLLKGGSPTSGTSGVRVYPSAEKSNAIDRTAGLFAREVLKRFSELPIEDELRLRNARIRDHFLAAIFTLAAFREVEETADREALARFHAACKLHLLACHQRARARDGAARRLPRGDRPGRALRPVPADALFRTRPGSPVHCQTSMSCCTPWGISATVSAARRKSTASG